jgi:catechol 2,3-dioxygenase
MTTHPMSESPVQIPLGVNHLVLNVRDIEESHHFWSELLGFRHVGTSRPTAPGGPPPMRFYSGQRDGKLHHHDIALYQAEGWRAIDVQSLNHLAVEYAGEAAWLAQIRFLTERGVTLHRRVERAATHSIHLFDPNGVEIELVFELPREQWEHDIDGALNHRIERPITG